jgi:hypothetical protein
MNPEPERLSGQPCPLSGAHVPRPSVLQRFYKSCVLGGNKNFGAPSYQGDLSMRPNCAVYCLTAGES